MTVGAERPLRVLHTVAVCLGTLLVLVGSVAGVVNREVLDGGRFADHVDAVRADPDVSRELGALITDRLIAEQPDLVAIRPLVETTATGVVGSSALTPIVRATMEPLHGAFVGTDPDPTILRLADVAAVIVGTLAVLAPDAAAAVPADLDVQLSEFAGREHSFGITERLHYAREVCWFAPLLGLALLAGAGAGIRARGGSRSDRVRGALRDVGAGVLAAGGLLALGLAVVGFLARRADVETLAGALTHAVWGELAGPAWLVAIGVAALGAILALASREDLRLDRQTLFARPRTPASAALRGSVLALVGLAVLLDPLRAVTALAWVAGALLLAAGVGLLAWASARTRPVVVPPAGPGAARALARNPRTWGAVAGALLIGAVVFGALPGEESLPRVAAQGRACNGHVELCARSYDDVTFAATHNSMSAADEGRWYFPEQPDGLVDQLDHGVRTLLIDSWYGRATERPGVVATVGEGVDRALAEAEDLFGEATVRSALRVYRALGLAPQGPTRAYLCHSLCELGATPMLGEMRAVREWLDAHPREVVTIFVQDEVSPGDTADIVEEAGLLPFVFTPGAEEEWPTLGQMIDSGRRLVMLMENDGGGADHPWLLSGFDHVQDTPYDFRKPGDLTDPARLRASCAPNRGPADAPLLLVNHWVTDKTAEITNARTVNAADVLRTRAAVCERVRGLRPTYLAVDFYDLGGLFAVVDELNGVG